MRHFRFALLLALIGLTACTSLQGQSAGQPTIATLVPLVSMTPRYTATPVPSRTPLPTFTFTPSDTPIPPSPTLSLTPSPTEPTVGIVNSVQLVNVREGPGVGFKAFEALKAGTGVTVLGQTPDGKWYNVRLDDGREGWIAAEVLHLQETSTPVPTLTPSPNLTALALGTPLPTALIGGGTVTPTPPQFLTPVVYTDTPVAPDNTSVSQPTSAAQVAPDVTQTPTARSFLQLVTATPGAPGTPGTQPVVPVIDMTAIDMTATVLASGIATSTPDSAQPTASFTPFTGDNPAPTVQPPVNGSPQAQQNAQVFALCDNKTLGIAAPGNLAAGSTITVWWGWTAKTQQQIQQHLDASTYEVRVDGNLLSNLRPYRTKIVPYQDIYFGVYWYVPYEQPLTAGNHKITYHVSWSTVVSDGFQLYGPGTNHVTEEGSCTFTVR